MANTNTCDPQPINFQYCFQVMDCIYIHSSDNSVTVEKDECGIDLTVSGNNLDKILKINDNDCVTWVKEFIDGVLNITPQIDWDCVAAQVCDICNPPTCPAPIELLVELV